MISQTTILVHFVYLHVHNSYQHRPDHPSKYRRKDKTRWFRVYKRQVLHTRPYSFFQRVPLTNHSQPQRHRNPNMVEWVSKYRQELGMFAIIAFDKIRSKTVHIGCTKIYFIWCCSGNTKVTVFLAGHIEIISMRNLWYFVDRTACFPSSNYVKYILDMTCHGTWCFQL